MGVALREGASVVIGRALPSDVILADSSLSRVHAKVTWRGDEIVIEDLGSTNGVLLGDERVQTATIAAGGDEVMLGRVRLVAHGASFVPADARSEEREFAAHVAAELRRASSFRRPLALMAMRTRFVLYGRQWCSTVRRSTMVH